MKKYLVSYDLKQPETRDDYRRLISHIKTYKFWAKPLKSVWLVLSNKSAPQIRDELKVFIDNNDALLVIEVESHWATFGVSKDVTNWMKNDI